MKTPSLATLLNAALAGSAAYAMYAIKPSEPYAFTGCTLAFWHGMLGVVASLNADSDRCNRIMAISAGLMEIVPLSLFNVELYKTSSDYSELSVVHFFFLLPVLFDFIAKLTTGFDGSTEILKDLTLLANVGSLMFLGYNEDIPIYVAMAAAMLLSKYGGLLAEYFVEDLGDNVTILFYAVFFVLVCLHF